MTPNNFLVHIEIDGLSDVPGSDNAFAAAMTTFLTGLQSQGLIAGSTWNRGPSGQNPIVANS